MTLTLDITDDLKPEEAAELVEIARQEQRSVGVVILEALVWAWSGEALSRRRRANCRMPNAEY